MKHERDQRKGNLLKQRQRGTLLGSKPIWLALACQPFPSHTDQQPNMSFRRYDVIQFCHLGHLLDFWILIGHQMARIIRVLRITTHESRTKSVLLTKYLYAKFLPDSLQSIAHIFATKIRLPNYLLTPRPIIFEANSWPR